MFQQIIALIIIIFFIIKLFSQKQNNQISKNEFLLWITFWIIASISIISIKWIDLALSMIGVSGSGIEILFYISVIIIFYLIFKIRIKLEKQKQEITKLTRHIALNKKND